MKRNQRTNVVKKCRKQAIFVLIGTFILSILLIGSGNSDRQLIKELLLQRSGIIQMVWYSSVKPDKGESMLKEIEVHPLLGEDVGWLRAAEDGMGFAYVLDLDVLKLNQTSVSSRGTCYIADILWELEEYNQHISEIHTYRIRTIKEPDGTVKLAELEPVL